MSQPIAPGAPCGGVVLHGNSNCSCIGTPASGVVGVVAIGTPVVVFGLYKYPDDHHLPRWLPRWFTQSQQWAGGHSSTTGYCGHHGWLAPSSGCWGDPVGLRGCGQVALHLLAATNGAHQGPKWQCVATRGQGCAGALLAIVATMGGGAKMVGAGGSQ